MRAMSKSEQDSEWILFRDQLRVGQVVEGVVIAHASFGIFVDIGSERFKGLVELPAMESSRVVGEMVWPALGSAVKGVQSRVHLAASDIKGCGGGSVGNETARG